MSIAKRDPDYTLNVFAKVDEAKESTTTVFVVRTTRVFVSFRYEIRLASALAGRTLKIDILGLHAPSILMPQSGPARGVREFDGLSGNYLVVVQKQDKSVNEFEIRVGKGGIEILKTAPNPFIVLSTTAIDLAR